MPNLPPQRVVRSRPFLKIGLDYLGPLYHKNIYHEKANIWICLITCMTTRAVHLELVFNNSTQEGGFYERLVRIFKSAYRKTVGCNVLSLQQLQTLVTEIEA
ncbi:unnamed protein product, partial [Strongylus vulgaris]